MNIITKFTGNPLIFYTTVLTLILTVSNIFGRDSIPTQIPQNFMSLTYQKYDTYETAMINIDQIVAIRPVFSPQVSKKPKEICVEVYLSNGDLLRVDKEYEDLCREVRVAQAR